MQAEPGSPAGARVQWPGKAGSTPSTGLARRHPTTEAAWVKWSLIVAALAFLTVFLFIPLALVFAEALK